jgi:exopolysaccharide biosynthesis protein
MKVTLHLDTNPPWPDLLHAIGGGPILVADGRLCVNSGPERFRSDITYGAHPRSAVGIAANGDIILLAVQGPGLTLTELAAVLLKLGAKDAMNLDGGGSTTLVVKGKVLNNPADGCQRAVSNALLVVKG